MRKTLRWATIGPLLKLKHLLTPTPDYAFRHALNTTNIGDLACGPYRYFEFPNAEVQKTRLHYRPGRVTVYGGGYIFSRLIKDLEADRAGGDIRVAWGVGCTRAPDDPGYHAAAGAFTLFGVRDYHLAEAYEYAPCVTCMHPFFEAPPEPDTEVVFYAHALKSDNVVRVPGMAEANNHGVSLEAALRFIARGETVVTNSYHGTYWGLLMGRKVLCVPFNRKFDGYRMPPAFAGERDWPEHVSKAVAQPDYYADCVAATLAFREKVMNL